MYYIKWILISVFVLGWQTVFAFQTQSQVVSGIVIDQVTKEPLPGANILLLDHEPLIGTSSDKDGKFILSRVPLGRQSFRITYLGFKTKVISEVLVSSGREVRLTVEMSEDIYEGESIDVFAETQKDRPINDMAYTSAKAFTVEETQRYAGGLGDPGRLVTAFAGVTSSGGVQSNAISIRGNAPKSLQWRLEGIEIPNPNHFAGLSVAGGGALTLFSAQLLSNSDFMTGAFPAEYGNALSGVFDINFKSGNQTKREHAFKIGINGLEASSGGPFRKGGSATYLFNYRFSTLTLLMPVLPTEGFIQYQDLSFKLDFPTQKTGRFSLWGIGGLDKQTLNAKEDSTQWEYANWDFSDNKIDLGVGALGLSHSILVNSNGYLKTSLAISGNLTEYSQELMNNDMQLEPFIKINNGTSRLALKSYLNQRITKKLVLRTGFEIQHLSYNLDLAGQPNKNSSFQTLINSDGAAQLLQTYAQADYKFHRNFSALLGLHTQFFSLSNETVLEPRMAFNWRVKPGSDLSFGYGRHSQIEELGIYHVQSQSRLPNQNLKMSKAHHFVAGWSQRLGEHHRFKTELFTQFLVDVPVIEDSSYSMLNFEQDYLFNNALINEGEGRNYGIEFTLERFLNKGYYYLLTGTFYKSRSKGGDGVWRNGRFDQNIVANALFGKEFYLKKNSNILGINSRFSITGGKRYSQVSQLKSREAEEVVFENLFFDQKFDPHFILDLTVNYRINRSKYSTVWALQVKNVLMAKDKEFDFNHKTKKVELIEEGTILPVISWEIQF